MVYFQKAYYSAHPYLRGEILLGMDNICYSGNCFGLEDKENVGI